MFCDDILAMSVDIGHGKSVIGYVGDECPRYFTQTQAGKFTDDSISRTNETGPYIFGENLKYRYQGIQTAPLLVEEKSNLFF